VLTLGGAGLVACSSDGADTVSTSTTDVIVDGNDTASGTFESIPRYPGSEPVGALEGKDGATTQSFQVSSASPQQVMDFYERNLGGWDTVEAPSDLGPSDQATMRGQWRLGMNVLTVSSSSAPGLGDNSTQYSLSLTDER
jgi:hypothetical protein